MFKFRKVSLGLLCVSFLMSTIMLLTSLFTSIGIGKNASGDNADLYRTKPLSAEAEVTDENSATLSSLQYNGTNIRGFIPNSFVGTHRTEVLGDTAIYKVELASGTTDIPIVTATATDDSEVEVIAATDFADAAKNFTLVKVTAGGGVIHYYKIIFTVAAIPDNAVYKRDFNDSSYDTSGWKGYEKGSLSSEVTLTKAVSDGMLSLKPSRDEVFALDTSENVNSYEKMVHAKIKFQGGSASHGARFGLTAVSNTSTFLMIQNDGGKLLWETNSAWQTGSTNFPFESNVLYDIAIKTTKIDNANVQMRFYVDGSKVFQENVPFAYVNDAIHNFGFRIRDAMTLYVDDLYVTADMPEDPAPPTFADTKEDIMPDEGTFETIQSNDMQVIVGSDFPFVYKYRDSAGDFLANGIEPLTAKYNKKLIVNGNLVNCVPTQIGKTDDSITYKLRVNDSDGSMFAEFTVQMTVAGKRLRMEFTEIKEAADTIVKSFSLPNHSMISMRGNDSQAAIGQVPGWGPMGDLFVNLNNVTASKNTDMNSYTLFNDSKVTAVIENNAVDSTRKFVLSEQADTMLNYNDEYVRRLAVRNNTWAWNYYNKSMAKLPKYEVPFAEVQIGGDENGDSDIDWHDAALSYRDIMVKPFKSETTKDNYTYIAFNMSGMANNPSVRILDRAKALSYLTDGFGQKIMNKGYQVGGHDDSHGDYDNVSLQQGGIKDFEYLSKRGADYNIKTGIHFNATEFAIDGFETVLANLNSYPNSLQQAWSWLDQAYAVNKEKDLVTGELERRVGDLTKALPNLDFVYVDVWQSGSLYTAKALQSYFEQAGYSMATEAAGDFTGDVLMYHWNTDLYYDTGGAQSEVVRFIYNDMADLGAPNRALLGMLMPGVAEWKDSNFNEGVETFYRNNLATKYLQYFELLDWEKDKSAKLSNNVRTEVTEEGGKAYFNLYKDEKLMAKIDVTSMHLFDSLTNDNKPAPNRTGNSEVFIPWSPITEEKIYYWNDVNETSTWQVPNSWADTTTAYLYKLTANGREFVGDVAVSGGQVTITADKSTPYILSQEKTELSGLSSKRLPRANDFWGEGSAIKNFGFSSGDFTNWSVVGEPTVETAINHAMENDTYDNKGDAMVKFKSVYSTLNQTLTVLDKSTYSFSVWAYTENRPVTLKITADGKIYSRTVKDTSKLNMPLDPNKYKNTRFQRLEVDVPIPEGVTTVQLELIVEQGAGTAFIDDFRAWEWQTPVSSFDESYLVNEDYENVDEQHGMFVGFRGGEPGFHLAQRDLSLESKQIKDYVIDGQWSLKDPYNPIGLHMRTVPATLKLDKFMGQYKFSMDYMTFNELRGRYIDDDDDTKEKVPAHLVGKNAQTNAKYSIKLCREDGTVIATYTLNKSVVDTTVEGYNSRPSVEHLEFFIDAQNLTDEGSYIAIYRDVYDDDAMLIIDNVKVVKMRRDNAKLESYTANTDVELKEGETLPATVKVESDSGQEVELPITYHGIDWKLTGTVQTGIAKIDTRNYYFDSNFATSYSVNVFIAGPKPLSKLVAYTKPADKVTAVGDEHGLPSSVLVYVENGGVVSLPVAYSGFDKSKAGVQTVTGTISTSGYDLGAGFESTFVVNVQVVGEDIIIEPTVVPDISGTVLGLGLGLGIPLILIAGGALVLLLLPIIKKKKV